MIVYVGGTFDLFHAGHVNFLRQAANFGDVWVSLNTDEFAERYKRKPVMSLVERVAVVAACRYVTGVTVNNGDEDSKPAVLRVRPNMVAHGDDWLPEDGLSEQMGLSDEWMREHNIIWLTLPYTKSPSTSEIMKRIKCLACV